MINDDNFPKKIRGLGFGFDTKGLMIDNMKVTKEELLSTLLLVLTKGKEMREAQRQYFKLRRSRNFNDPPVIEALDKSKQKELEFDQTLAILLSKQEPQKQYRIFDED